MTARKTHDIDIILSTCTEFSAIEAPEELAKIVTQGKSAKKKVTLVSFRFENWNTAFILKWGLPYNYPEDPMVEAIVNGNFPVVNGVSLRQFLSGCKFWMLVPDNAVNVGYYLDPARLPQRLEYPFSRYGAAWDVQELQDLIEAAPGPAYPPMYS